MDPNSESSDEKSPSRALSDVGRVFPVGEKSVLPLLAPAIILILVLIPYLTFIDKGGTFFRLQICDLTRKYRIFR